MGDKSVSGFVYVTFLRLHDKNNSLVFLGEGVVDAGTSKREPRVTDPDTKTSHQLKSKQMRIQNKQTLRVTPVPDELVVVEEGGVFDQAETLLHPVDKGLDLQVGHLVQWEKADAPKNIQ